MLLAWETLLLSPSLTLFPLLFPTQETMPSTTSVLPKTVWQYTKAKIAQISTLELTQNGPPLNRPLLSNSSQLFIALSTSQLTINKSNQSAQPLLQHTSASHFQDPLFLIADVLQMVQSSLTLSFQDSGYGRIQLDLPLPTLSASPRPLPSPAMVNPPKQLTLTGSNKL